MKVIALTPGTMGLCGLTVRVVGVQNVYPTGWGTPVYFMTEKMSSDDVEAAVSLIKEEAIKFGVKITASEQEL